MLKRQNSKDSELKRQKSFIKTQEKDAEKDADSFEFDSEELEHEDSSEEEQHEEDAQEEESQELEKKLNDLKVYLPGVKMENDELLVVDKSTYELLHPMNVEWPCLSFDILKDKLGENRSSFPMSCYIAAGSQAEAGQNKVFVFII